MDPTRRLLGKRDPERDKMLQGIEDQAEKVADAVAVLLAQIRESRHPENGAAT